MSAVSNAGRFFDFLNEGLETTGPYPTRPANTWTGMSPRQRLRIVLGDAEKGLPGHLPPRMSFKDLPRYVNEFAERHLIRDKDTVEQMCLLARVLVGKPLRYRDLTAHLVDSPGVVILEGRPLRRQLHDHQSRTK